MLAYFKQEAGRSKATGMSILKSLCSTDADVEVVWWRTFHLSLAVQHGPEFAEFHGGDEIDEGLVRLFAEFPFRVVEVSSDGSYRLNADEFQREFEKLKTWKTAE